MAFTATDLAAIETAIASGALSVRYADRSVTYRSMDELIKARDIIKAALAAAAGTSYTSYVQTSKGLAVDTNFETL